MKLSLFGTLAGVLAFAPVALADSHEVVCRLPVGDQGIHYADENTAELKAWGPGGLTVAPDGTFWVSDTASRRLLHYGRDCALLGVLPLKDVQGVTDLVATGDSLYALDVSADPPTVLHLSLSGAEYARYPQ
jgi:hypothetical protein